MLNCERIGLYVNFDKPLTGGEISQYKSFFRRRLNHEPLQYIIGEAEFMGLKFFVDQRVLIPRQDTEVLVEQVIRLIRSRSEDIGTILEIGTGSGCIAISLARHVKGLLIEAVDVSQDALEVANENVQRYGYNDRVKLIRADIFKLGTELQNQKYDIIVSNPPYISRKEYELLPREVKFFEPAQAYFDNADGLTFYRIISLIGRNLIKKNGWVFLEIAYDQSKDVNDIFSGAGYSNVESVRDYDDNERVIKAQWCN